MWHLLKTLKTDYFKTDGVKGVSQRSHIRGQLREAIISGELKAGTQLKQNEVSQKFQCSPGPVREAMRDLESEGLIEHFHNRGVFVTKITADEFLHMLLPTRLVLEKYALKNIGSKFDPDVVADLKEQIETMRRGAKAKNINLVNAADIQFHTIIMELAATQQTLQLWKSVFSRIRLDFYKIGHSHNLVHQASEHEKILEVLMNGSENEIESVLKWHILGTTEEQLAK